MGCPGLKEARGFLFRLMEQAQSGFRLLQDVEKFITIMLHVNAGSRVGKFLYDMCLDRTVPSLREIPWSVVFVDTLAFVV